MEMDVGFLEIKRGGTVCIRRWGVGERLLIGLHGFAEDASSFEQLQMPDEYTVVGIDLPFHGKTQWNLKQYTPSLVAAMITEVLEQTEHEHYELAGHSLGGRLALCCLPYLEQKPQSLFLLAPDGLDNPYAFWMDGIPVFLRKAIAQSVQKPEWLLKIASILRKWDLIDAFALRYLRKHLKDAESQLRLFGTWQSLSYFRLSEKKAIRLLKQTDIPGLIILGEKDRLNSGKRSHRIATMLKNVEVVSVSATHALINKNTGELLQLHFNTE